MNANHPVKTIILKGWYGERNFGDDLLLAVLSRIFGAVGLDVFVWSKWAKYLRRIAPNVRPLEPWSRLRAPVALVYGGGTQFFTFPGGTHVWYTRSNLKAILRSPRRIARAPITVLRMLAEAGRSARARRASFRAALGIGVGPFWGSCQDTSAKLEILRSLDWLSVRDNESKETCVINGLHAARLGADLAFLYPAVGQHVEYRSNEVIVVPRSSPMDQDWVRWESAVVRSLRSLSAENIVILSLCERDAHVAHALALKTMARVEKWDPSHMRFEDIIFRLSSARLVISARYHGALVSAAAGVPTIILGLDQKLHSLGNQLPTAKVLTTPEEAENKTVEFVDKAQQLSFEYVAAVVANLRKLAIGSVCDLLKVMSVA